MDIIVVLIKRRYPHKLVTALNMKEFPSNEMSYILGRAKKGSSLPKTRDYGRMDCLGTNYFKIY